MRIGIDFDNTIVSYDALFYQVAVERNLIPSNLPSTKLSVRDYLRQTGKEETWTEIQGYIYGARMGDAVAYPGVIDFFVWAKTKGVCIVIVSHKTRHPILGYPYDLHEAARGWITKYLTGQTQQLISESNVHFESTKQEKLTRIAALDLDCFVDDLPEILLANEFPARTTRILFDPDRTWPGRGRLSAFPSWEHIKWHIQGQWVTQS